LQFSLYDLLLWLSKFAKYLVSLFALASFDAPRSRDSKTLLGLLVEVMYCIHT